MEPQWRPSAPQIKGAFIPQRRLQNSDSAQVDLNFSTFKKYNYFVSKDIKYLFYFNELSYKGIWTRKQAYYIIHQSLKRFLHASKNSYGFSFGKTVWGQRMSTLPITHTARPRPDHQKMVATNALTMEPILTHPCNRLNTTPKSHPTSHKTYPKSPLKVHTPLE